MVNNNDIAGLFSTPVYIQQDKYSLNKSEIECIKNFKRELNVGKGAVNSITQVSNILSKPELKKFRNFIQQQIDIYFHEIIQVKKAQNYKFYITQSWGNYNKKNESHATHWHPNSMLSGVFIVQTDGTPLIFYKDSSEMFPLVLNTDNWNNHNSNTMAFETKANTLYLFPSVLRHGVGNNISNTERISVAFNTFVKGSFGFTNFERPTQAPRQSDQAQLVLT
jgi:uncharacterized protein (TIGR02466 family)